ncbi:MAG: hypothetical protein ACLTJ4_10155 [Lachnospiraceae bacterium]
MRKERKINTNIRLNLCDEQTGRHGILQTMDRENINRTPEQL